MNWLVIIIGVLIGGLIGAKIILDRSKGKTNTFQQVPIIGGFSMIDWWKPNTPQKKNILIGKMFVFLYMLFGIIFPRYLEIMVVLAFLPVLFHVEYFSEDGH